MQIVTYKCDRCGRESKDADGMRRLTLSFPYIFHAPGTEPLEEDLCSDCIADILRYAKEQKEEPERITSELYEAEAVEEEPIEAEPEPIEPTEPEKDASEERKAQEEEKKPDKKKRIRIDREEMWNLYMSGVSVFNIAKQLGCKTRTVHSTLSRMRNERLQDADA